MNFAVSDFNEIQSEEYRFAQWYSDSLLQSKLRKHTFRRKKRQCFMEDGFPVSKLKMTCEVCGRHTFITTHHVNGHLFNQTEKEEVQMVCGKCHKSHNDYCKRLGLPLTGIIVRR